MRMMPQILVILSAILALIIWHKINPETTWAYAIYVFVIIIIYLIVQIVFL